MRNVESKFRCVDHEGVARRALVAGARDEGLIRQRDQFYRVPHGRLKLRTTGNERCELIAYQRDDARGARASDYARHATTNAASLDELLGRALPRAGVLEKTRHLLIRGNTRIHLDDVVGLGRFVELETVIHDQTETDAQREHLDVVEALGLGEAERISVAYVDLLKPEAESSSARSAS